MYLPAFREIYDFGFTIYGHVGGKAVPENSEIVNRKSQIDIGRQGWTRTNTERFNRPSCYFDTTWQWRCRQEFHLHRSV